MRHVMKKVSEYNMALPATERDWKNNSITPITFSIELSLILTINSLPIDGNEFLMA